MQPQSNNPTSTSRFFERFSTISKYTIASSPPTPSPFQRVPKMGTHFNDPSGDRYVPSPTLSYYTSGFIPPTPAAFNIRPRSPLFPRKVGESNPGIPTSSSSSSSSSTTVERKVKRKTPPSPLNLGETSNGASSSYARPIRVLQHDEDHLMVPTPQPEEKDKQSPVRNLAKAKSKGWFTSAANIPSPSWVEIEPGHKHSSWIGGGRGGPQECVVPNTSQLETGISPDSMMSDSGTSPAEGDGRNLMNQEHQRRQIGELPYVNRPGCPLQVSDKNIRRKTLIDRVNGLLQQKRMQYIGHRKRWQDVHQFGMDELEAIPRGADGQHGRKESAYGFSQTRDFKNGYEYTPTQSGKFSKGVGTIKMMFGMAGPQRILLATMSSAEEERLKEKQKKRKVITIAAVIVLVLAAVAVAVAVSLFSQQSHSASDSTSSGTLDANGTPPPASSHGSAPTSLPNTSFPAHPPVTAYTLASCLDDFAKSAPSSPLSYPCSSCTPLLTKTISDFANNQANTGVGAALQFCALQSLFTATMGSSVSEKAAVAAVDVGSSSVLSGWMSNASPCNGWSGVNCDSLGRITGLSMIYPAVPAVLDDTFGHLVGLKSFKLIGNNDMPTGSIPSSLFTLSNLTNIDIQSTSLTSLPERSFDSLTSLNSILLSSNAKLGSSLPSLKNLKRLRTLSATGQNLNSIDITSLPSSLTYIDLSYNSLSGEIANLTSLSALTTLYLTSNSFRSVTSSSSFPSTLQSLSLASNTDLTGSLPAQLCSSPLLSSCDVRNTGLRQSMQTNGSETNLQTYIQTGTQVFATTISGGGVYLVTTTTSQQATSTIVSQASQSARCGSCSF